MPKITVFAPNALSAMFTVRGVVQGAVFAASFAPWLVAGVTTHGHKLAIAVSGCAPALFECETADEADKLADKICGFVTAARPAHVPKPRS